MSEIKYEIVAPSVPRGGTLTARFAEQLTLASLGYASQSPQIRHCNFE